MTQRTFFFIKYDGTIIRREFEQQTKYPFLDGGYKLAADSNQVIEMTSTGRGKTIKNRYSAKPQYFTRNEMILLSLQAESI